MLTFPSGSQNSAKKMNNNYRISQTKKGKFDLQGWGLRISLSCPRRMHVGESTAAHINALSSTAQSGYAGATPSTGWLNL